MRPLPNPEFSASHYYSNTVFAGTDTEPERPSRALVNNIKRSVFDQASSPLGLYCRTFCFERSRIIGSLLYYIAVMPVRVGTVWYCTVELYGSFSLRPGLNPNLNRAV